MTRVAHRPEPTVRRPTVAGSFYPADRSELADTVDELLAAAAHGGHPAPVALVVPHAGYVYSGPVAATAYATLRPLAGVIRRVALLGPAHRVRLHGLAVPATSAWATPLGLVRVDADLRAAAVAAGAVVADEPHRDEHALEVQLPFLQRVLGAGFTVLPVAVGESSPAAVADLIERVAGDPATRVLVSTDLSHYHDRQTAVRLDRRTADAVLARAEDEIGPYDACGSAALRGLLAHARRRGLVARLLDLRTSADTAGDPRRVVGYGAFAFAAG